RCWWSRWRWCRRGRARSRAGSAAHAVGGELDRDQPAQRVARMEPARTGEVPETQHGFTGLALFQQAAAQHAVERAAFERWGQQHALAGVEEDRAARAFGDL